MDWTHKHEVIASFNLKDIGIFVTISDVIYGFRKGMVLKSISSGLYWEVQERILHFKTEKRFENETEIFVHLNVRDLQKLADTQEKFRNLFEYKLIPIGHQEKPKQEDFLIFSSTIARPIPFKIIDIYENYFLLDLEEMQTGVLHKRYVLRRETAKIGDFVRHCEHKYHDLVDEFGNFIYRK